MAEPLSLPELEEQLRRFLQQPRARVEFVRRLEQELLARAVHIRADRRRTGGARALRWAVVALLVALVVGVMVVGPANLAAAMQRLLGYIPGIGLVQASGGLRVLAEPVSQEREGITVTIEQAVADVERTTIVMTVDGIPPEARPRGESAATCFQNPELVLPEMEGAALRSARRDDGGGESETLGRGDMVSGSGRGWGSGYSWRMVFAALPSLVDRVTLHIPCLFDTAPGTAPEDWQLEMRFIPAPAETTIVPVVMVTPAPAPAATEVGTQPPGLVLEQVIELEDRYILIGAFRQGEGIAGGMVLGLPSTVEITVADGQPWPWNFAEDIDLPVAEPGVIPWAVEIPKGFTTPIVVSFPVVDVEIPVEAHFQVDVAPGLSVGERVQLDELVRLGGHALRLVSLLRADRGYELEFESDEAVIGVTAVAVDPVAVGGWGGGTGGEFVIGFEYAPEPLGGPLRFRVTGLVVSIPGPWTVTWSPPPRGSSATPPSLLTPCLTLDRWQQIAAQVPGQSPAFTGKVIGEWANEVFVVDLETGARHSFGPGNWPDLSSDGRLAAYSGTTDGLHVVDLLTGEDWTVPGTTANDYGPRWSPDGSWLAFRRIDDLNLYRVRPDGSGLERLTQAPEYELLVDWTSDGSGLYFGVPAREGVTLRILDLATGGARDLFTIDAKDAFAAISPDGTHIAYVARVPGAMAYGLYLSSLDGSAPWLLVHVDPWGVGSPLWSPDGQWLLVTLANSSAGQAVIVPVLLDPRSCRAYPLSGFTGYLWAWAP